MKVQSPESLFLPLEIKCQNKEPTSSPQSPGISIRKQVLKDILKMAFVNFLESQG